VVSSSFLRGKLLRSVLHLFHQAFVQCVRTETGALTGLWLGDGVAWLTFKMNKQPVPLTDRVSIPATVLATGPTVTQNSPFLP